MSSSVWKMFIATFAFVLVVAYVAAEIPSYIHVCGRQDQNLQECIMDNVENLRPKLCQGIPELDVIPLEPIVLNRVTLFDTPEAKVIMEDTTISGLCNWIINSFQIDLDKLTFDVKLTFKRVLLNGTLGIDARILVPIALKQPIFIIADDVSALANIEMKTVTKGNVKYVYLPKMTLNLDIKEYDFQFGVSEETKQFQEVARNLLGNSGNEVFKSIKPLFEESISHYLLDFSNKIIKHFTYDELFPDRI